MRRTIHFILIGGWAAYLYTKTLKSKDIDIIIDYDQLPQLQKTYDLTKNDRLKKYEAVRGDVQIDVYVPHYSDLGIPAEALMPHTTSVKGFTLIELNYLVALKIYALSQRGRSAKGRKDLIDLVALLNLPECDIEKVRQVIKQFHLSSAQSVTLAIMNEQSEVPELNMNAHHYAKLRQKSAAL